VSLIYGNYLANVHFGDIPHTFIPRFTLHFAEKICIEFICKLHHYNFSAFHVPQNTSAHQRHVDTTSVFNLTGFNKIT